MSSMLVRRVVIRGRVQRVGYRNWTEFTAIRAGLAGWVRNRLDGSVEAVFAGSADSVEAMITACRGGPAKAQVDSIEIAVAGADDLVQGSSGFTVLPTL